MNVLLRKLLKTNQSAAIHGDKQQNERDWVLDQFKTGKSPIMVATDVASRGIGMITIPLPSPNSRSNFQQSHIRCALLSCVGAFSIARICLICHYVLWFSSIQEFWGPWYSVFAIPLFRRCTLLFLWYNYGVGIS